MTDLLAERLALQQALEGSFKVARVEAKRHRRSTSVPQRSGSLHTGPEMSLETCALVLGVSQSLGQPDFQLDQQQLMAKTRLNLDGGGYHGSQWDLGVAQTGSGSHVFKRNRRPHARTPSRSLSEAGRSVGCHRDSECFVEPARPALVANCRSQNQLGAQPVSRSWSKATITMSRPDARPASRSLSKAGHRAELRRDQESSDGPHFPSLLTDGHWHSYVPNRQTIVVIGPGAGMHANADVYAQLVQSGYDLVALHSQEHDEAPEGSKGSYSYPPGWQQGSPNLGFNRGKNLATLADDVLLPAIRQLIAEGRGPAAVLCGSRGGQVTLPRLWEIGWRGPCVVINGGCASTAVVPGSPVRLVLATGGRDFFKTKSPESTARMLKKADKHSQVLNYFHPDEAHMPSQLGGGVLLRLLEIACLESFTTSLQALGPWPGRAKLLVI